MSGPYSQRVYAALTGPVEFITGANVSTAAGLPLGTLDVLAGHITFDEEWAPYVQATITAAPAPFSIEPRIIPRLLLTAGYGYPDGTREVHQLANLSIVRTEVDEVKQTITITARSDEALVMGSGQYMNTAITNTYSSYGQGIQNALAAALAGVTGHAFDNSLNDVTGPSMTGYIYQPGDSWWSHIESMRDSANGVVYCDEHRVWHIARYATDESPDLDAISTGDAATTWPEPGYTARLEILMEHAVSRDRETWGNAVLITNNWTGADGLARTRRGTAAAIIGPYGTQAVGVRLHSETRTAPTTQTELDAAAQALLYRVHRRGETRTFAARAAFWLRPRHLHRFWLSGVDAYFRITRVSYQLDGSGLMTFNVRTPEPEPVGS